MSHVYAGEPDGRQSLEPIKVSRFRPRYRPLTDAEKALHDAIKAQAAVLETLFEAARNLRLPPLEEIVIPPDGAAELVEGMALSPALDYFNNGMKSLELAVMWTVKGLTS